MIPSAQPNIRRFIEAELESSDLFAHRVFQEEVEQYASEGTDELEVQRRCWDEVANEYACNLGHMSIVKREFFDQPVYRSDYLDELVKSGRPHARNGHWPMQACEVRFAHRLEEDSAYGFSLTERASAMKAAYASRFGFDVSTDVSHADLVNIVAARAERFGMLADTQEGIRADLGGRGSVHVAIEKGYSRPIFQVPLFVQVELDGRHADKSFRDCLRHIVPGFSYFKLVRSNRELAYGIDAYLVFAKALSKCLVASSAFQAPGESN